MKAARIHSYREPLVIEEVPTPVPGPGQVVIKVAGAGFCHSDLHVIDGEIPILPSLPHIMGHENAGHVAALGAGVTAVREGDPVLVYGGWGCGHCDYCVSGSEQLCATPQWAGLSQWNGGYAEYLLVPHARYLINLSTLDPRVAAPLTDAALTPYRAIKKALPHLDPDHMTLVIGLGGLGQYGVKLLRLMSGSPIIAVDVSSEKLELAREYGASHMLNGRDADIAAQIMGLTGGCGVNTAFDFVGSEDTLSLALGVTRTQGKVTQLGLAGGSARMKVLENTRFEVAFEATLWGTIKELREVVGLVENGRLTLTHSELAPLERINDVYARLKAGQVKGRAIIVPS